MILTVIPKGENIVTYVRWALCNAKWICPTLPSTLLQQHDTNADLKPFT